jgi:hypothetical protein
MANIPRERTLADALVELVGRSLSSVTFVMDYIQFGFDGSRLTAYTLPAVSRKSVNLIWGQPGYRDALCEQIGSRVASTGVNKQSVAITFDTGATISVSLRGDDYCGPEALEFSLEKDCIWVV